MPEEALTYRDAGVDIDEAHRALRAVLPDIRATYNDKVVAGVGGFGGLFDGNFHESRPILVSSIDGVGTKTKVAAMVGDYSGLGCDIVNHCVNDILCQGARPLFFMDYFGTGRLHGVTFEPIVRGIAQACASVGMVLLGGETAELPGVYVEDELDVVGSIVGVVDAERKLPRPKPKPGDALIGLASNGLHTNGFSLARRALFDVRNHSVRDLVPGTEQTIGEALLAPHRCYFNAVYPLIQEFSGIYGMAHITGGGIYDNLPRALPSDIQAVIEKRSWTPLPIFHLISDSAKISEPEMYRTFNMGIGAVLVCDRAIADEVVARLNAAGEMAAEIGTLQNGGNEVQLV
jgi:phosphoribosylformylglycinamidine cyclo-ligase